MVKNIKVKKIPVKKVKSILSKPRPKIRAKSKRASAKKVKSQGRQGIGCGSRAKQIKLQNAFLEAFVKLGTLRAACKVVNMSRQTHYDWLNADPTYKPRFESAEEDSADRLEAEAIRRAVDGDEVPVGFYMGEASEYVTQRSDTLLKFLLEGRRKKIFGRRTELTGPDGGPITIQRIERIIVDPEKQK